MEMKKLAKEGCAYAYLLVTGIYLHNGKDLLDLIITMDDLGWRDYMGPASSVVGGSLGNEIIITSALFRRLK